MAKEGCRLAEILRRRAIYYRRRVLYSKVGPTRAA
jgi:hypothetical protein